jgi:predicted amidophosphoribosyltransferase
VDYPRDEQDWLALIDQPVELSGPFDWGVAIGRMVSDHGSRRRSPLGSLLWSFKNRDDDQAAEILAAVLVRFLERCELPEEYDGLVAVPPSFQSRPGPPVESLLTGADRELPLPLLTDVVKRTVAMAPQKSDPDAGPRPSRDESMFVVDASVAGKRLLLVDDFYNTGETIGALVHALRERGAARVGVVAICCALRTGDD